MKWYYIVFGNGFVDYKESDDKDEVVGYANTLAYEHDTWVQDIWREDENGEYTEHVY